MARLFSTVTSLFDLISGRGPRTPASGAGQFFVAQSGYTQSGEQVSVDTLLEDATVIAGINAITSGISQIPMLVKKKTENGYVLQDNHPVQKVLMRPNVFQTPSEFKKSIVTSILVHGNAFIKIIRVDGQVRQLVPMDASDVTLGANRAGMPTYSHDEFGIIPPQDIIHIRDVSNFTPQGHSRLLLAAERIGALKAADRQMATTFRNGVNMNYIITMDAPMAADEREAFQTKLSEQFGKEGNNQGGALALPSGATMQAVKGSTPADTDLRALRQDMIREIAAVFGVPAYMLGTSGDEKYNNVRQKLASFHRDTLNPIMVSIQEAFTLKLLDDRDCVYFDVEDFVKGAFNEQADVATRLVGGGIWSPNEGRAYVGKNPVKSTEEFDYDMPIPPNSSTTESETVSETVEGGTGGEDGPQSLENRPERAEDG